LVAELVVFQFPLIVLAFCLLLNRVFICSSATRCCTISLWILQGARFVLDCIVCTFVVV